MQPFCQNLYSNQSSHYKQNPLFCKQLIVILNWRFFIDRLRQTLADTCASSGCNKRKIIYKNTSFRTNMKLNKVKMVSVYKT